MPLDTGRENLDVNGRRDLRNSHLICSIDPKGCEDVDDALSVQRLPNGLMELGVHIADVTHYVLPNSFTDLEARARATTVYLSEKRYDMLPSCLSSNLCSLLSSVDRYAVSILWTLDNNCHITDVWFGRTVIRSSYKLFYELAQEIVNGDAIEMFTENCQEVVNCNKVEVEKRFYQLRDDLTNLTDIARTLKIQRLSEGALELENDEVQFEFEDVDRTQIARLRAKQSLEIHETVAECMIFANQWVAMKIYDAFPTKALLRRHPEPGQEQFEHLRLLAQFKGFEFNTANNIQLSESLNKCIDPDDHCVNKLMRSLVIHAMKPATYFSTGSFCPEAYYHYGLALEYYTHFTSPIRRYADILVHRLLLAIAENNTTGAGIFDNRVLEEICEHINENQLAAKHVQRQSRELFHAFYFASLPLEDKQRVTDAIVYAIRANGVLVYVPKYAIKGPVYLVNKDQKVAFVKGDRVEWTSGRIKFENFMLSILASDGGIQSYKLFDHITVCVVVVSSFAHAPTVKLDIINNRPHPDRQIAAVSDICGKTFSEQVHALHKGTNMKTKVEGSLNQSNFNKKSIEESLYTVIEDLRDLALKTPKS